jgi:hypothetical protein
MAKIVAPFSPSSRLGMKGVINHQFSELFAHPPSIREKYVMHRYVINLAGNV